MYLGKVNEYKMLKMMERRWGADWKDSMQWGDTEVRQG